MTMLTFLRLNVFLIIAFLALDTLQAQPWVVQPDDSLYVREHYDKMEVMIPMRDGIRLFTSIYMPKDKTSQHPVLLNRTPYSVGPYGNNEFKPFLRPTKLFARESYILVYQDVRGCFMSEGDFKDIRPYEPAKKGTKDIDENSDTYDTIDWLLANLPGNNGKVGIWGISYPGFYSTIALPGAHPALKAVSPQAPVTDWFLGDDFHHNGAFMLSDAFSFFSSFGKPRPLPTTKGNPGFDFKTADGYKFFLEMGPLRNANEKYLHDGIPFWNDMMAHPDMDAWWKARNIRPHLKNIRPAVLTVGGLFDAEDCYGAWRTYEAIEKQNPSTLSNRLVMGPWVHGGWNRTTGNSLGNVWFGGESSAWYQQEVELKFFNYYLQDKGTMDLPEIMVFETGKNKWNNYTEWPPKAVKSKTLYFQSGGGLSWNKPVANESFDEYVSDPAHPVPYTEDIGLDRTREYMTDDQRFASRRPDVLTYTSDVLTAEVSLAGVLKANLFTSITGTDADFVVKLIDVFPEDSTRISDTGVPMGGYQMLVRGEVMRGRYRNSFEKPEAFVPGQVTEVNFELPDVCHTFLKGHRIMIQVQSSWFPLVDRNPQQFVNIYKAVEADFIKAAHRVYHDQGRASGIEVLVRE